MDKELEEERVQGGESPPETPAAIRKPGKVAAPLTSDPNGVSKPSFPKTIRRATLSHRLSFKITSPAVFPPCVPQGSVVGPFLNLSPWKLFNEGNVS